MQLNLPQKELYLLYLVDKNDNEAIVSIKDNGQGIDSDMLLRLFPKFATKSFACTGLGLFICKSIVDAHGGRIWAQNDSDTKGAIFFIYSSTG